MAAFQAVNVYGYRYLQKKVNKKQSSEKRRVLQAIALHTVVGIVRKARHDVANCYRLLRNIHSSVVKARVSSTV